VTYLGERLVRMQRAEEWTDSVVEELPTLRINDNEFSFRPGRRIDSPHIRMNLEPADDAQSLLAELGGELVDTYRIFRLTQEVVATPAGAARIGTPCFRFTLPIEGSGKTRPPLLDAIIYLVMNPDKRADLVEADDEQRTEVSGSTSG
jgi:hypothetical protein